MIGFPVQNSHELVLLERIKYMVEQRQVKDKNEFLEFDTMRQCAQCLGRVMRKKTDYGLMILADVRFNSPGKYHKLPLWIRKALHKDMIDVTMEAACALAGKFFREMGKPFVLVVFGLFRQRDCSRGRSFLGRLCFHRRKLTGKRRNWRRRICMRGRRRRKRRRRRKEKGKNGTEVKVLVNRRDRIDRMKRSVRMKARSA